MSKLSGDTKQAEAAVRRWLRALDHPVASREQAVVVGLGLRGAALWRGLIHACSGPTPVIAAEAVLRALVDNVILLRWIELSPVLHIDMWLAEDDRGRIHLGEQWSEMHRRRGGSVPPAFDPEEVNTLRDGVAVVRSIAREADEPIGERGSVMPTIEQMSETTTDLFEAYQVAYRSLSPSAHSGARSFVNDAVELREDGWYLRPASAFEPLHLRALGVPVMCFLLASVSRQLGLGIEGDADALRVEFTRWTQPDPTVPHSRRQLPDAQSDCREQTR